MMDWSAEHNPAIDMFFKLGRQRMGSRLIGELDGAYRPALIFLRPGREINYVRQRVNNMNDRGPEDDTLDIHGTFTFHPRIGNDPSGLDHIPLYSLQLTDPLATRLCKVADNFSSHVRIFYH